MIFYKDKKFKTKPGDVFVISRPESYVYCFEEGDPAWSFKFFSIGLFKSLNFMPEALKENPVFSLIAYPELKMQLEECIESKLSLDQVNPFHDSMLGSFI